jgi:hypothetical protein
MEPNTKYKLPFYAFGIYTLSLIGMGLSVAYSQSCEIPNCDLISGLLIFLLFIPLILISAITLITSFVRRKKKGLPISKFHRWTTLITVVSPLWIPIFMYILPLILYFGVFDFREFKPEYTPPGQIQSF